MSEEIDSIDQLITVFSKETQDIAYKRSVVTDVLRWVNRHYPKAMLSVAVCEDTGDYVVIGKHVRVRVVSAYSLRFYNELIKSSRCSSIAIGDCTAPRIVDSSWYIDFKWPCGGVRMDDIDPKLWLGDFSVVEGNEG